MSDGRGSAPGHHIARALTTLSRSSPSSPRIRWRLFKVALRRSEHAWRRAAAGGVT